MLDHNNSIKPLTDYIPKECRKSVNEYATWSTRERITSESIVQKRALNAKRRRERDDQVEKRAAKETKREALRTLAAMKPVVEIPSARGTTALGTNASTTITTNTMNMRSVELYRAAAPIKLLADITLQEHQALAEKEFIAKPVRHTKVRSNVTPLDSRMLCWHIDWHMMRMAQSTWRSCRVMVYGSRLIFFPQTNEWNVGRCSGEP